MTGEKWNDSGRVWEEDHGLLDDQQVAKCQRADVAEPLHSPVPTRMISNGEYMPVPQTEKQKRVEARIEELADQASKKLGSSRRNDQVPAVETPGYFRPVPPGRTVIEFPKSLIPD